MQMQKCNFSIEATAPYNGLTPFNVSRSHLLQQRSLRSTKAGSIMITPKTLELKLKLHSARLSGARLSK